MNINFLQSGLQSVTKLLSHPEIFSLFAPVFPPPPSQCCSTTKSCRITRVILIRYFFQNNIDMGEGGTKISFFLGWLNNFLTDYRLTMIHYKLSRLSVSQLKQFLNEHKGEYLPKPSWRTHKNILPNKTFLQMALWKSLSFTQCQSSTVVIILSSITLNYCRNTNKCTHCCNANNNFATKSFHNFASQSTVRL